MPKTSVEETICASFCALKAGGGYHKFIFRRLSKIKGIPEIPTVARP